MRAVDPGLAKERLVADLVLRLRSLAPGRLVAFVADVLRGAGYSEVRVMHRRKGASRPAGGEITATVKVGRTAVPVIASVKVQGDPVSRRAVYELRGRMAALGIDRGMVVTAGTFRPGAAGAAGNAVDLVDAKRLAEMMVASGVGIRMLPIPSFEPDDAFFSVAPRP